MRNSWNRSLEEVAEAVCGRNCVDLLNDTIKILEIHFSNNKKVQMQNNFITTIKNAASFCLCNSRTLTLEVRNMIFRTLLISKVVYLALITNFPKVVVEELQMVQKKS